jgi:hypothetical protein
LGLNINVIPAHESAFAGDQNATPIPMPFHIDLERLDFDVPHIGFFFYVKADDTEKLEVLKSELYKAAWFEKEDLKNLETFDQVKALAVYAIENYPK